MILSGRDAEPAGAFDQGNSPEDRRTYYSVNPANGHVNAKLTSASFDDVDQVVRRARTAYLEGEWRERHPHERGRTLNVIADALDAQWDALARVQTSENGKTLAESMAQARSAAKTFRYFGALCETAEGQLNPSRGNYFAMTTYEPVGVVAAIVPWNSPLTMAAQKIAPALAAGNAVVLKPSEITTLTGLALAEACRAGGLPDGQLSVLTGVGDVGAALVAHSQVNLISFTGGTESGRQIAVVAAGKFTPVILELGGKSPNIVFSDADLDAAASGVAYGIFHSLGQSCVAGSRVFVERKILTPFLDRFVPLARALKVGMPEAPGVKLGPCASFAQRQRIESYVKVAVDEGGTIICGGKAPTDAALQEGAFYLPTVITGLSNGARAAREEIFGPVAAVLPFDTEDELVGAANDSPFGLACGIWTGDYRRAWRTARAVQAGTVWINTYKDLSTANPFGGVKDSGLGREKGPAGLRAYQLAKSVYFGLGHAPHPWATT